MSTAPISPKRQLLIAKQRLDKLAIFITNLIQFYQGVHPNLDAELSVLKKQLSGKPDYDAAGELSSILNAQLKQDSKYLQQRNLDAVSQIKTALRNLSTLDSLDEVAKKELGETIKALSAGKDKLGAPVEDFERALNLYQLALGNLRASPQDKDNTDYQALHDKITQELKELIAPFYITNKSNQNLSDVYQKLNSGIGHQELLECCLILIRHVIRDVIKEANSTSRLVDGLHNSLIKISEGLKATIKSSKSRSAKRLAQTKSMQTQLSEMEMVVSDSHELEDLKLQAQRYLEKMQSAIKANQKEEDVEQNMLMRLMEKMQERIAILETEAISHKQKLFAQRKSALSDPLTKLPNRMAYEERLKREVAVYVKENTPLCLSIIDIDLFKNINDKYGHSVGDKTLQVIASNISKHIDKSCFVARWGGEEFVCVMPSLNIAEGHKTLENVRKKIASLPFKFKGEKVQVTISIGLAEFADKRSAEDVFDIADKRLYAAKSNGRNQTVYTTES